MGSCLNQQGHAPWEALQPPGGELRLFHHTAPEAGFGTSPSPSLSLHQANSRAQQKASPPPLEMSPMLQAFWVENWEHHPPQHHLGPATQLVGQDANREHHQNTCINHGGDRSGGNESHFQGDFFLPSHNHFLIIWPVLFLEFVLPSQCEETPSNHTNKACILKLSAMPHLKTVILGASYECCATQHF